MMLQNNIYWKRIPKYLLASRSPSLSQSIFCFAAQIPTCNFLKFIYQKVRDSKWKSKLQSLMYSTVLYVYLYLCIYIYT